MSIKKSVKHLLSPEEEFFEKRYKLMKQLFFDQEYKKRNFLISNNLNKFALIFDNLHENIINNPDNDYRLNLEDCVRKFKHIVMENSSNAQDIDLSDIYDKSISFLNSDLNKGEILRNYIAIKEYSIPLYCLITPLDMTDIIPQYENNIYEFKPFIPEYIEKNDFIRNYLLSVVLSYLDTEYRVYALSEKEKNFLYVEFNKTLNGGNQRDFATLTAIFKCSNGAKLDDDDFIRINKEISNTFFSTRSGKKSLLNEEDNNQKEYIKQRLIGLLYYDFVIALTAIETKTKIDDFIDIFYSIIDTTKENSGYDEATKRKYRDAFKYASMCIEKNELMPMTNKLKIINPPKITIPEHLSYFTDYQSFYYYFKKNGTFDSSIFKYY